MQRKTWAAIKIIVAIADVAAYVRPASALDREARKRGNSTYFPDRVVPMLPERISNDLCSLKEGEDRPALACHITIDAEVIKSLIALAAQSSAWQLVWLMKKHKQLSMAGRSTHCANLF